MEGLTMLNLGFNLLSGNLPAQWMGMKNLTTLFLHNNTLSGTVPLREWANLTSLETLFVSYNNLTGSLPSGVRFPNLTILSNNQLSGSLPSDMSGAMFLDLSRNSLSGALPDPLTAPHLEVMLIGRNQLQKPVPDCWLYHRACLPSLELLGDGGLLRESASSYSWRRRNCRDELAFQWGDLRNITKRISDLLRKSNFAGYYLEDYGLDEAAQADIKMLCSNQNVPSVLGGLWGCFAALLLAGYALRKVVVPRWQAFLTSRWAPGGRALTNIASAATASIYWYDWVTDVMVIQEVWPAWTGGLLLALALLNYAVSGIVIVLHASRQATLGDRRPPQDLLQVKLTQWTVGWLLITAVMPLLDTVVLLLYLLQDTYMPVVQIPALDIDGFMHMRDVVKALTTALPTAVLTSVVYAMGNSPKVRLVFTQGVFVASLVGSLTLVLWAWYSSLFECQVEGIGMRELFRRVFTGKTLSPDTAESHPEPAAAPTPRSTFDSWLQLSFATSMTASEVKIAGHRSAKTLGGSTSAQAAGRRAKGGSRSSSFSAAGAGQARAGPAPSNSAQSAATCDGRTESTPPGDLPPQETTGSAAGRGLQRAEAGTELQRDPGGQQRHARNFSGNAINGKCSPAADSGVAGDLASAAPGKDTSEDSQSAQGAAGELQAPAYSVKDWVLWGLRLVVKIAVVLGPVAAVILIDYYKEGRN
eukprot:jgi/Botrbrau1/7353/Bobra.0316s0001.1